MTIERILYIPQRFQDECLKQLGCEYKETLHNIVVGKVEAYMFDNSFCVLERSGEQVTIVILVGEKLNDFTIELCKLLKQIGIKELIAHTKRKGMVKYMENIGAKCIGHYSIYSLEL